MRIARVSTIVFLLAAPALLASCGGASAAPDPAAYISDLRASGNSVIADSNDDALLSVGKGICAEAAKPENASAPEKLKAYIKMTGLTQGDSGSISTIAAAAFKSLCPDSADLYSQSLTAKDIEISPGITADEVESTYNMLSENGETSCTLTTTTALSAFASAAVSDSGGNQADWEKYLTAWHDKNCSS